MGKMVRKYKKPIVVHSLFSSKYPHSLELLRYYGIPVFDSLDVACKCIGVLAQHGDYLKSYHAKANFVLNWGKKARPEVQSLIDQAKKEGRRALLEPEAKELFRTHGVSIPKETVAATADEAAAAATEIGFPVAMKIVSPEILHKSDAGGVRLDIPSEAEARKAFASIMESARRFGAQDIRGVLVGPMLQRGQEVIIGTKTDDQFGPVIMFGIGGILVEVLKDVVFRVLPISSNAARKMVDEIRSAKLLDGFRGGPPSDKKALKHLLTTVSDIVEAYPDIEEMDLNPVRVHEKGLSIADARVILKS